MPEDLKLHLDALENWLETNSHVPNQGPGLSSDERKQLQGINKTIQDLGKLGVPVPDELRSLKIKLTAKDVSSSGVAALESRLSDVEEFISAVREILQTARDLRERLKSTVTSSGTKAHYGVSIEELLRHGYLTIEDRLELQWIKNGDTYEGKLCEDGRVMAKSDGHWRDYNTLSMAAAEICGRPLNGWDTWSKVNEDGSKTPLKKIRERFMNSLDRL